MKEVTTLVGRGLTGVAGRFIDNDDSNFVLAAPTAEHLLSLAERFGLANNPAKNKPVHITGLDPDTERTAEQIADQKTKLASDAVAYILNRAIEDDALMNLIGNGTATFEKLTHAYAAVFNEPLQDVVDFFSKVPGARALPLRGPGYYV